MNLIIFNNNNNNNEKILQENIFKNSNKEVNFQQN